MGAMDWSDHAMWWPEKNIWLDNTRWTLDQYNITADAFLQFTPMHKTLRIQLPDLRYIDCRVDFSIKTFNAVLNLCGELEIRHPEELSLCKRLDYNHLKFNYSQTKREEEKRRRVTLGAMPSRGQSPGLNATSIGQDLDRIIVDRPDTNTFISHSNGYNTVTLGRKTSTLSWAGGTAPRSRSFRSLGRNGTMSLLHTPSSSRRRINDYQHNNGRSPTPHLNGTWRSNGNGNYSLYSNGSLTPGFPDGTGSEWSLAMSPPPSDEAKYTMVRPKNLVERARMNVAWLDSSLSIMEQGIRDFDTLLLRFKFVSFYDLNPKMDPVRINLIYEQAKWQLLNEGIDCTEEEMMLFAALQLQVGLQANVPQPNEEDEEEDDIDAALTDLQIALEGNSNGINGHNNGFHDIMTIPSLNDTLRYLRPKKFTLKGYRRSYFLLKDLSLAAYRCQEDAQDQLKPRFSINLKGCEITPEVNISHHRYGIKLAVPSAEGMSDLWLKCDSETQYSRWLAACRMAAKGKTMADSAFDSEVKAIQAFLSMQHPASQPVINPATLDIKVEDYVATRFLRKTKSKLRQKILEAHANVKDLNLLEAKMYFIKAWQSLPDFGVSLFVVRFHGEKRDELLGIAYNRIMRMSLQTGDHIKTWRYNTIM